MTNEEKSILEAFLSRTLQVGGESLSELYNSEGELISLKIAEDKDAERVLKFKTEKQKEFDKGLEKGASKIEKAIREKYKITDSELIGPELVDHVIELQTAELNEKLKSKGKDEDFEKHPKYIDFKKAHEAALKAKDQEWETKLTERENEWNRKEALTKVVKRAFGKLDTDFVMPENAERANALKEVLQRELESGNYKFDNDEIILLDKEGRPLEDKHGNLIQFNEHIDSIAGRFFDKRVANPRGNSGNQNQPPQQNIGAFKSQDEYLEAARNAKTPEQQVEVFKKYQNSKF